MINTCAQFTYTLAITVALLWRRLLGRLGLLRRLPVLAFRLRAGVATGSGTTSSGALILISLRSLLKTRGYAGRRGRTCHARRHYVRQHNRGRKGARSRRSICSHAMCHARPMTGSHRTTGASNDPGMILCALELFLMIIAAPVGSEHASLCITCTSAREIYLLLAYNNI